MTMFRSVVITLALCLATVTAQAALLGRAALTPGGADFQAYYDDELNITWLEDARLSRTNSFGVAGIDINGLMTWGTATQWVAAMNLGTYLGASDWRLPTVVDTGSPGCNFAYTNTDCGFNVQTKSGTTVYSELGHLYYVTLGLRGGYDATGAFYCGELAANGCGGDSFPFDSILGVNRTFWSGTEYSSGSGYGWVFSFGNGSQSAGSAAARAWAVRSGDIAAVPAPAAVWLLATGLAGLGGRRWMRRKISS